MIDLSNMLPCTGCHACISACPMNCISMKRDEEGFLYPKVNRACCVQCGKCVNACPLVPTKEKEHQKYEVSTYAAVAFNEELRMQSSSGGVFSLIAEWVIRQGGVVFGPAFDEELRLRHIWVDCADELSKLRGSKYLQSTVGRAYIEAKEFLEIGRCVLFTGTPCQIAGLRSYLGREYDNLYTQDVVCHGVPSPMVWEKYVEYREAIAASKTRRTFFRHKKNGWKTYSVQFEFANCTEYVQILGKDLYMKAFLKDLCLRPSCYDCAFKGDARASDISLADFWGVWDVIPEMYDDKGTSLVIINSNKGQELFEQVKDKVKWIDTDKEQALRCNSAYYSSPTRPEKRESFIAEIRKNGFTNAEKLLRDPLKIQVRRVLVKTVKKILGR